MTQTPSDTPSSNVEKTSPDPPQAAVDERLWMMLDTVPAFLSYIDRECRYQIISKHYEAYFQRPRSEILGRHMREIIGERAWHHVAPAMEQALRGKSASFEASLDVPGLGIRHSRGTYTPDLDAAGNVRGVVVLVEDITQRKQYELQLEEKDAYYRSIFDSPGVSNFEADLTTGEILRANQSLCSLLGYTETELIHGVSIFGLVHPADKPKIIEQIKSLRSETLTHAQVQLRYQRREGNHVWMNIAVTTLRGADGKPHRILATAHDITSKVAAEEALREAEERVRLAVTAAGIG